MRGGNGEARFMSFDDKIAVDENSAFSASANTPCSWKFFIVKTISFFSLCLASSVIKAARADGLLSTSEQRSHHG